MALQVRYGSAEPHIEGLLTFKVAHMAVPTRDPLPNNLHLHTFHTTGVFGHRAILIWGDRGMAEGFLSKNKPLPNMVYSL